MGVTGKYTAPKLLSEGERIEGFDCGKSSINAWAEHHAHLARTRGTAVVYVSRASDGSQVAGFYALSSHSICRSDVNGGWLKRNTPEQIPAVLLGMLGVDKRFQSDGLGAALLGDAISRCVMVSESIGAKAIIVDPLDDDARAFYSKYGFAAVPGTERMYLPLKLSSSRKHTS